MPKNVHPRVHAHPHWPRYASVMSTKRPLTAPQIPPSTGKTASFVDLLRTRREDLGWSQEELGEVLWDYLVKMAERFDEPTILKAKPSKETISQWERMFSPNASTALKRKKVLFPQALYAAWARVLGLRQVVDFVGAEDPAERVFLPPEVAGTARRLNGLPDHQRELINGVVTELFAAYRDDHEEKMPLQPWHSRK